MFKLIGIVILTIICFVAIATISSCKNENATENSKTESAAGTSIDIGQSYQGGIVAYILQPGDPGYNVNVQHGLIAAPSDQIIGDGIEWYNGTNTTTGATGTAIGTGKSNTALIIAAQGAGYAANICATITVGGYTDWYLPSKDELNELYVNKAAIGGFDIGGYWSSSEDDKRFAWIELFNDGRQMGNFKDEMNYVRAVRRF